jgi:hypothetical protein
LKLFADPKARLEKNVTTLSQRPFFVNMRPVHAVFIRTRLSPYKITPNQSAKKPIESEYNKPNSKFPSRLSPRDCHSFGSFVAFHLGLWDEE